MVSRLHHYKVCCMCRCRQKPKVDIVLMKTAEFDEIVAAESQPLPHTDEHIASASTSGDTAFSPNIAAILPSNLKEGSLADGPIERGSIEDGPLADGHMEDGHMENGHTEDGHMEAGHMEDGHTQDGHMEDGPLAGGSLADTPLAGGHMEDGHGGWPRGRWLNFWKLHSRWPIGVRPTGRCKCGGWVC